MGTGIIIYVILCFIFGAVFGMAMYKLGKHDESTEDFGFEQNRVVSKFDTDEKSIDEVVAEDFDLLDFWNFFNKIKKSP